jgi:hypothetical protein
MPFRNEPLPNTYGDGANSYAPKKGCIDCGFGKPCSEHYQFGETQGSTFAAGLYLTRGIDSASSYFASYDADGDMIKPKTVGTYAGYFKRNNMNIPATKPLTLGLGICRYKLTLSGASNSGATIVDYENFDYSCSELNGVFYPKLDDNHTFSIIDDTYSSRWGYITFTYTPTYAYAVWGFVLAGEGDGPWDIPAYGEGYEPRIVAYLTLYAGPRWGTNNYYPLGQWRKDVGRFDGTYVGTNKPSVFGSATILGAHDFGTFDGTSLTSISFGPSEFKTTDLYTGQTVSDTVNNNSFFTCACNMSNFNWTLSELTTDDFAKDTPMYEYYDPNVCKAPDDFDGWLPCGGLISDCPKTLWYYSGIFDLCCEYGETYGEEVFDDGIVYKEYYQRLNTYGKCTISGLTSKDLNTPLNEVTTQTCERCENLNREYVVYKNSSDTPIWGVDLSPTKDTELCCDCDDSICITGMEFYCAWDGELYNSGVRKLLCTFSINANNGLVVKYEKKYQLFPYDQTRPVRYYYSDHYNYDDPRIEDDGTDRPRCYIDTIIRGNGRDTVTTKDIVPPIGAQHPLTPHGQLDLDFNYRDIVSLNSEDWQRCDFSNVTINLNFPAIEDRYIFYPSIYSNIRNIECEE